MQYGYFFGLNLKRKKILEMETRQTGLRVKLHKKIIPTRYRKFINAASLS